MHDRQQLADLLWPDMEVEYVDADEFEALEALLVAAESRLGAPLLALLVSPCNTLNSMLSTLCCQYVDCSLANRHPAVRNRCNLFFSVHLSDAQFPTQPLQIADADLQRPQQKQWGVPASDKQQTAQPL